MSSARQGIGAPFNFLTHCALGKAIFSKMYEFLENFQMAFDPPRPFFGKNVAISFYKIFWNGNDPPKLLFLMLKILQRYLLDRK